MGIALLLVTIGAAAVTIAGWLGFTGQLKRNHFAGIRTSYTMSSDERWHAVHRAGGPILIFAGVAATAAGLAFTPFALAGAVPDGLALAIVIVSGVLVVSGTLASWRYGTSRAKAQLGDG